MEPTHEPVLLEEAIALLDPSRGGLFVDCTVGLGGHAGAILSGGATRLLGLDRDPGALALAAQTLAPWHDRVELVHADYRDLPAVPAARGITAIDGALADLGVSSMQFDAPGRGFSFRRDEALDMRMDQTTGPTAAELLARVDEADLADVIFRYGEDASPVALRDALSKRDRPRRLPPPRSWPTSSAAPFLARATSASTRRHARFRRCESGSIASSKGSTNFSLPRRVCCERVRGWRSSPSIRSKIVSSSMCSGRWQRPKTRCASSPRNRSSPANVNSRATRGRAARSSAP